MPLDARTLLLPSSAAAAEERERSVLATATPPAYKIRHPSQILSGQRHIHFVEYKYCKGQILWRKDTRPKNH
eukprot:1159635-Pelagomonas_calceolata.AAC.1